jgi:phosphoribosyl 1,2-cyclic phosphodiesterase
MSNIIIGTLCSGSKGNCTLVKYRDTAILVDAGRSTKYIKTALASVGILPEEISAIFLTHSHSDHTSALKVWTAHYHTPIHASGAVCSAIETNCGPDILCPHPIEFEETVGDIGVRSFPTDHDSFGSVGYRFTLGDISVGIATDLGHVTDCVRKGLAGCVAAVVESNHDVDMLLRGPYPPDLKQRILSRYGHLSNESGAEFARFLADNGTTHLMLAHISEINNTPELAYRASHSKLSDIMERVELAVSEPAVPVLFNL